MTQPDVLRTERPLRVVAGAAAARRDRLADLAHQSESAGERTFLFSLALQTGGPWAGVRDVVRAILPEIEDEAPALLERHRYELALALPEMRDRFPLREASLTDAAPVKERVRSFPVDRAYRLVHGLVDLVGAWLERRPDRRAWLGFDDYDAAGALARRFVLELDRRLGDRGSIGVAIGCGAEAAEGVAAAFAGAELERLEGAGAGDQPAPAPVAAEAAEAEAEELDRRLDGNLRLVETHGPRLIELWERRGRPMRALRWRVALLAIYNHFGYYQDALDFGDCVLPHLDSYLLDERAFSRWHVISGLFNANIALGRPERALELLETEVLPKVDDPTDLISVHYAMAMLHARFLRRKDLPLAEEHLRISLSYVDRAPLDDADKCYLQAFNWNGLAFIRHLQGKPEEALELCQRGLESLRIHLSEEQHRLHRSVLLYNIAQVHASLRNLPAAIEHYTAAMEIDPRYSEYYNERGAAYLGIGKPEEAIADLRRAIELSAPYPEVWINLGQAYRHVGRDEDAVAAYTRALELDPSSALARIGRAQARASLGAAEGAIEDYGRAIALDPKDPLLLSNRGALLYELGRFDESLADLEAAVALAPDDPDLEANRAIALAAVAGQGDVASVA